MITYTIKKRDGEYIVRFHQDGVYMPGWTYYTTDKEDAKSTAETVVNQSK